MGFSRLRSKGNGGVEKAMTDSSYAVLFPDVFFRETGGSRDSNLLRDRMLRELPVCSVRLGLAEWVLIALGSVPLPLQACP